MSYIAIIQDILFIMNGLLSKMEFNARILREINTIPIITFSLSLPDSNEIIFNSNEFNND